MRLGAIVLAVCLGLGLVEALQLRFGSGELAEPSLWLAFWRAVPSWLLLWAMSPVAVWASDRWPMRGVGWARAFLRHLAMAFPFALAHLALAAAWGSVRPGGDGLSFGASLGWLVNRYLVYGLLSYGALVGVVHAYRYHQEMERRRREAAALLEELEVARLRAAEGKLHPHFVFNTLNAITGLAARGDQRAVTAALEAFSELLRATLDDEAARLVPLREELELLRSYVAIQKVRFGERLRVEWDLAGADLDRPVPVLLLQPLVENALTHGVGRSREGGTVVVRAHSSEVGLSLEVEDSGADPGRMREARASDGHGIGLDATRGRLRALFGDAADVELREGSMGGTVARVRIPVRP